MAKARKDTNPSKNPFIMNLENPDTTIGVGDCLQLIPALGRPESFDLVFADPPFNWGVNYDVHDDELERDKYLKWTYDWLRESIRALRPGGALWVNIPDDTAAEIVVHCKNVGLTLFNWCIWHFRFGQHGQGRFITSKVHALYFVKPPNKLRTWNGDQVLEPSDRAAVYGDPRTMNVKQEGKTAGMRVPLDVWYGPYWGRIQGNNAERRPEHENQLPEVYLERVIRACSNPGDLVLDPFLGSGTTTTVARALGRRSVGIELSEAYARSAFERTEKGAVRLMPAKQETSNFHTSRRRTDARTETPDPPA